MVKKCKIILLMLMFTTGMLILSACSGGEADEEVQEQKKESSASLGQFAGENGEIWSDSWSADTASGASMGIRTNTLIEVPELKQMSIVEVQRYTFDKENKKKMAEAVFDEVYYHDEEHLLDYEIQELINNCQANLRSQKSALQDLKEKENKEKTDENDIQNLEEGIKEDEADVKRYEKLLKKAPKDYVKVEGDDYKGKEYIGKINGIQYLLEFEDYEDDIYTTGINDITLRICDKKDVYPEGITGDYGGSYGEDIKMESENKSKITKEEAVKTAREFLQKVGFADLILVEEEVLKWEDNIAEENDFSLIDGWHFVFSPGAEDVPFSDYVDFYDYLGGIRTSETEVISDERFSPDCRIIVSITDKGVIDVDFKNPIMVLSSTPGVKLLPLDDIKTIIKNEMGGFAGFLQETKKISNISFNRLTLGYYRVSDPEHKDQYTYVPAWRLWSNSGSNLSFVVNAMDGSVIEDWTEKRKIVPREE